MSESKALLETYYNPVFHIFFDTFITTETTLKQKSNKVQVIIQVINTFVTHFCRSKNTERGIGRDSHLAREDIDLPSRTAPAAMAETRSHSSFQAASAPG